MDRAIRKGVGRPIPDPHSHGAFATLSLSTFPTVRQLGIMVALALVFSFVASVFVLPSLLTLWARRVDVESLDLGAASPADDD